MTTPRYALSIKQPWAALLISGRKTLEVRKWPTYRRGSILIHAARIPDSRDEAWKWVTDEIRPLTELRGGIIGSAMLTDCIPYPDLERFTDDADKHLNDLSWFDKGLFGFVFEQIQLLPFRKLPGNIRFFTVPELDSSDE
jgi:hypothetical protein